MSRLTVVAGEMVKKTVVKNEFSQLNDKRFYFPDGIVSLPFYHPLSSRINEFKQKRPENWKVFLGRERALASPRKRGIKKPA